MPDAWGYPQLARGTVGQCGAERAGELVVVGPRLLQAHHIGPRLGEPRQQAEILRRPLLDRRSDAVDVDCADDHGDRP